MCLWSAGTCVHWWWKEHMSTYTSMKSDPNDPLEVRGGLGSWSLFLQTRNRGYKGAFVTGSAPQGPTRFQSPLFFDTLQFWREQEQDKQESKVLDREVNYKLSRGTQFQWYFIWATVHADVYWNTFLPSSAHTGTCWLITSLPQGPFKTGLLSATSTLPFASFCSSLALRSLGHSAYLYNAFSAQLQHSTTFSCCLPKQCLGIPSPTRSRSHNQSEISPPIPLPGLAMGGRAKGWSPQGPTVSTHSLLLLWFPSACSGRSLFLGEEVFIKSEEGENLISTPDPPKSMVQSQPQRPKLLKLKITYIKNRLVAAKEERVRGKTGREVGVNRCKLLHRMDKQQSPTV